MSRILSYIKRKWYFFASFAVMLISFAFKAPTGEMIVGLEWNGLTMIFVSSLALAGLRKENALSPLRAASGVFEHLGAILLWFIILSFVLSAFISSIAASLFLIPLSVEVLKKKERDEHIPGTAAAIALSANAGGMLLPSGSIQNMLLNRALPEGESFALTMLPFALLSIPVLLLMIPAILRKKTLERVYITGEKEYMEMGTKGMRMLYITLIAVIVISSFGLFRWFEILLFTLAILLVFDRKVFIKTDYTIFLSVFFLSIAGNALDPGSITLGGTTLIAEIIGSGAAASLLLPSSHDIASLLIGSNIGSFGTILSFPALFGLTAMLKEGKREARAFALSYTVFSLLILMLSALYIVL